jgi:hypothetical protein
MMLENWLLIVLVLRVVRPRLGGRLIVLRCYEDTRALKKGRGLETGFRVVETVILKIVLTTHHRHCIL